jgi:hypothetical protein
VRRRSAREKKDWSSGAVHYHNDSVSLLILDLGNKLLSDACSVESGSVNGFEIAAVSRLEINLFSRTSSPAKKDAATLFTILTLQ